jgi:hypothetical protein
VESMMYLSSSALYLTQRTKGGSVGRGRESSAISFGARLLQTTTILDSDETTAAHSGKGKGKASKPKCLSVGFGGRIGHVRHVVPGRGEFDDGFQAAFSLRVSAFCSHDAWKHLIGSFASSDSLFEDVEAHPSCAAGRAKQSSNRLSLLSLSLLPARFLDLPCMPSE